MIHPYVIKHLDAEGNEAYYFGTLEGFQILKLPLIEVRRYKGTVAQFKSVKEYYNRCNPVDTGKHLKPKDK